MICLITFCAWLKDIPEIKLEYILKIKGRVKERLKGTENKELLTGEIEIEAKEIVMEMYGVEPIKRSQFDGVLDNKFVKIANRLNIKIHGLSIPASKHRDNYWKYETEGEKLRIYEEAVIDLSKRAASVETARTEINHYNNSATQRD